MARAFLSISTFFNLKISIEKMFPLIREAGFKFISLSGDREHTGYHTEERRGEIKRLLSRYRLQIVSIHAPYKGDDGDLSALDKVKHKRFIGNVKGTIDAAEDFGVEIVDLHLNARFKGKATKERIERVREAMGELSDYALSKRVKLSCENLPEENSYPIFETILKEFNFPHIGVCYDTSHAHIAQKDFSILKEYRPRLFSIHISDDLSKNDDHLLPYQGDIDWEDFKKIFKELDFHGVVMIESSMSSTSYKEPKEFLSQAYKRGVMLLR